MKEKAHTPASLTTALKEQAVREGFEAARITAPTIRPQNRDAMNAFIKAGHYGDMTWMQEKQDRRLAPQTLWPDVRSIIMLTMNYGPSANPLDALSAHENGVISVYAKGKDYHGIIKKKLKNLARWFVAETGAEVKVFVDTAPVMEKPLGETAGLGWQGKHTNLVSRQSGSWLFLGSIFTNYELPPDEPGENHCGNCRKCLDICPTKAFDGPYKLDARRCISYLTIEHQGHIPEELRLAMGNRVYGCDDCLAVCPWNKFAKTASEHRFAARSETDNPPLAALLQMDDAAFRQRFQGTPIKRTGRDRFLRNCLIAAGNSGQPGLLPHVRQLIDRQNEPALVRAAAIWAFRQLASAEEWEKLKNKEAAGEDDPAIKQEWA